MLWAIAVYDLGLTSEQFWKITPAQFFSLCERRKLDLYRLDLRSGVVAATIANCNRSKDQAPFYPETFMASAAQEKAEAQEIADAKPTSIMEKFAALCGVEFNGIQ